MVSGDTRHAWLGPRLVVIGAGLAVVTVAGFAGRLWWPLDLAAHFRPHYLVLSIAVAALLLVVGARRMAAVAAVAAVLNGATILPLCVGGRGADDATTSARLRLMSMNLDVGNERADLVMGAVDAWQPDLIILLEVDERWERDLASLRAAYPFGRVHPRSDGFGLALLGRVPLDEVDVMFWEPGAIPSLVGVVDAGGGGRLRIVATHPVPPSGGAGCRMRNEHLADLAEYVARQDGPVVVMGDLNVTPWSAHYRDLVGRAGLARAGRGIDSTWPGSLAAIGIPIDHCLHTDEVVTVDHRVGPVVGSDHRPLLVEIALRPAARTRARGHSSDL